MKILALDSATEALSVALYQHGECLVRESTPVRGHGQWLLPAIDELLSEAGLRLKDLDGLAVGRGPGAFTGVRIAVSVAQGLAFATDLPILPVSDLAALALGAAKRAYAHGLTGSALQILACLDARMNGLYAAWVALPATPMGIELACFDCIDEGLYSPHELPLVGVEPVVVAGHGWVADSPLADRLGTRVLMAYPDLLPQARWIAALAAHQWPQGRAVAAEALLPVYLRDEVATRSTRAPGDPR